MLVVCAGEETEDQREKRAQRRVARQKSGKGRREEGKGDEQGGQKEDNPTLLQLTSFRQVDRTCNCEPSIQPVYEKRASVRRRAKYKKHARERRRNERERKRVTHLYQV